MYIRCQGKEATRRAAPRKRERPRTAAGAVGPAGEEDEMKFVVEPQREERQESPPGQHTRCRLCSEDPRFCF